MLLAILALVTSSEAFIYVNETCREINSILTKDIFQNILQVRTWDAVNRFHFPLTDLNADATSNLKRITFDDSYNYTASGSCFNNYSDIYENSTAAGAFYVMPSGKKYVLRLEVNGEPSYLDYAISSYKNQRYLVGFNCTQMSGDISRQSLMVLRNPKVSSHSLKFMNFCRNGMVKCERFHRRHMDILHCNANAIIFNSSLVLLFPLILMLLS